VQKEQKRTLKTHQNGQKGEHYSHPDPKRNRERGILFAQRFPPFPHGLRGVCAEVSHLRRRGVCAEVSHLRRVYPGCTNGTMVGIPGCTNGTMVGIPRVCTRLYLPVYPGILGYTSLYTLVYMPPYVLPWCIYFPMYYPGIPPVYTPCTPWVYHTYTGMLVYSAAPSGVSARSLWAQFGNNPWVGGNRASQNLKGVTDGGHSARRTSRLPED